MVRRWPHLAVVLTFATLCVAACATSRTGDGLASPSTAPLRPTTSQILEAYGGQAAPEVRVIAGGAGRTVLLDAYGFVVAA